MADLPTGTVAFLFTDIEGSATLWEQNPAAMKAALARHDAVLRKVIEARGGRVFKVVGDSFQAAFAIASEALAAAVAGQRALAAESWGEAGPLKVRMGLHVGLAEPLEGDYVTTHTLNRVARVMSAGHGGQVLLSLAAAELVREHLPPPVQLQDLGEHHLKGLRRAERLFQALASDLPAGFPPLNVVTAEAALGPGAVLHNRYRIEGELGRGGLGVVYRAHDTILDRAVAVKVLSEASLGSEGRARLLREAQAAARLNHPNIVSLYDVGEANGVPFIVMELVAGLSLHEHPPGDLGQVLAIARQVCAALDHAHTRGIIHRDLKPENVLVAEPASPERGDPRAAALARGEGPAGAPFAEHRFELIPRQEARGVRDEAGPLVKLMDFGLARSVASRLSAEGAITATVFYMAPEVALGQAADARADLYALGVMLYELAAGRLPFAGDDALVVVSQHLHAPLVSPRAHNAALPPGLEELILRLMSKRPEERPASARDVLRSLEKIAAPGAEAAAGPDLPLLERIARGRLVGRDRELAEVGAYWQRAMLGGAGETRVLLLSGEPGIGKTRLVRELATRAEVAGGRVLAGDCYPEGGAPYAPIAQIIQTALAEYLQASTLPPLVLADLLSLAPSLRPLFPEALPNPPLDPEAERQRLFESVVTLFEALAARAPLLVVVDDAHWADSGTLYLVRHLARRLRRRSILLVVTYREVELSEARPLHEVLLDLNRERLAARVKLGRLSREQTRELLAALFTEEITPEFLDAIYRETEGNPFFVEEVCKSLVESGKLYFADGRWRRPPNMDELEIPQSVRVAIQARVSKLPDAAQEMLRLAAILGREFDFETLLHAGDQDEEALLLALEAAERAQLVEEAEGRRGEVYVFAHALIPSTLREAVSGRRRRRLHQRAARAIEALRPQDFDALAHHFAAADEIEKAIAYSRRAAQRAEAVYAHDQAIQHLRLALELLEPGEQAETRLEVLEQLGDLHSLLREGTKSIPVYQEALALSLQASATEAQGIAVMRLHRKILQAGLRTIRQSDVKQLEAAYQASLQAGLKLAEDPPPQAEAVRLLTALSSDAWWHRRPLDWDGAERFARAAVALAERLDAPVELSAALSALANVYGARGMFRERAQTALRRLELSQGPRFNDLHERVDSLHQAGQALMNVGDYREAIPHLLEAERLAEQIQEVDQQTVALRYQSQCWHQLDQWDRVLEIQGKWRALERRYANFLERGGTMCFQLALEASVHARRGEFDTARRLREESMAIMVAGDGRPEAWARSNHY